MTTKELLEALKALPRRERIPGLLKDLKVQKICEVGVHAGSNFKRLLHCEPQQAVAVDIWKSDALTSQNDRENSVNELEGFYQNICELKKKHPFIEIQRMFSVEAAKLYPDGHFDYVYIDADHTYPAVKEDILAWWPKVRSGGILGGHDYKDKKISRKVFCGVKQAVNEFVFENDLVCNFAQTPERCPSWLIIKP